MSHEPSTAQLMDGTTLGLPRSAGQIDYAAGWGPVGGAVVVGGPDPREWRDGAAGCATPSIQAKVADRRRAIVGPERPSTISCL